MNEFVIPLINKEFSDLNPLYAGIAQAEPNYTVCEKRDYSFIQYILAGKGTLEIYGKTYNLEQNQIFIVPEGVENSYTTDPKDPWIIAWLSFNGNLSKHFANLPPVMKATRTLSNIFQEIIGINEIKSMREEWLVEKLFKLYVELSPKITKQTPNYVRKAIDYIDMNLYDASLTVENIAKALNIDRSYLSHCFKESTGKSVKKHILEIRMNMAISMLQTGESVQSVSKKLGYADPYVFSKAFKNHTGSSPQSYKNFK